MSFGVKFGLMVRQRRTEMGLSATELATRVFGRADDVKRILDIETGLVEQPHSRMMAALTNALWITPEQVQDCRSVTSALGQLPPHLASHIHNYFNAAQPSATAEETDYFLRCKRSDYLSIRKAINNAVDPAVDGSTFAETLNASLEEAAFDICDQQLKSREPTRKSIAAKVALLCLRADIALIADNASRAAALYGGAADLLNPIIPDNAADLRNRAATRLYRHAHRLNKDHGLPIDMLRANLAYWKRESHPEKWAMTQVNLANALNLTAAAVPPDSAMPLLEEAIAGYRQGLEIYSETEYRREWMLAQSNFAAALSVFARCKKGDEKVALLQEAAEAFSVSIDATSKRAKPGKWAGYQSKLADIFEQQARTQTGAANHDLYDRARRADAAALTIYTPDKTPAHWVATQNSLANAQRAQAAKSTRDEAKRLLSEAISNYRAAIEVCDRKKHGAQWSALHNNLALALVDQAKLCNRLSAGVMLTEAIRACQTALTERSSAKNQTDWMASLRLLGEAHLARAICAKGNDAQADVVAAIRALEDIQRHHGPNSSPARMIAVQRRIADAFELCGDMKHAESIKKYEAAITALKNASAIAEQAKMESTVNSLKQRTARIIEKIRTSERQNMPEVTA